VQVRLFFDDQDFDGQLLRALSYAAYGGADIGECLETAARIKEGDRSSWYEAWTKTADRMKADAEESLKGGHTSSARGAYMRASNYYRAAEFYVTETILRIRAAFGVGSQATTASPRPPAWPIHLSKP
jgi:hypothetical protein